jgi:hypothetical protein
MVPHIHQAVPFASFDPFFKGTQHPFRPHRRFHPLPAVAGFSGLLSLWHCRRSVFLRCVRHKSTFLRSLRSTPVTRLPRYYGRSDSCSPGSSAYTRFRALSHELRHLHEQVSPIIASGLPDHSVSNHPACPVVALSRYPSARQVSAFCRGPGFTFGMQAHQLSPDRIEFVFLRTSRSPPAAPHPASRRRSCSWLRAGERLPGGDFHPSDHRAFRAHIPPTQLVVRSYLAYSHNVYSPSSGSGGQWQVPRPCRLSMNDPPTALVGFGIQSSVPCSLVLVG